MSHIAILGGGIGVAPPTLFTIPNEFGPAFRRVGAVSTAIGLR